MVTIFDDEANELLRKHIDEFFVDESMSVVTHVGCRVIRLGRPVTSAWGLRGLVVWHLRREHA